MADGTPLNGSRSGNTPSKVAYRIRMHRRSGGYNEITTNTINMVDEILGHIRNKGFEGILDIKGGGASDFENLIVNTRDISFVHVKKEVNDTENNQQ